MDLKAAVLKSFKSDITAFKEKHKSDCTKKNLDLKNLHT